MTDLLRVICDGCGTSFVSVNQHRRTDLYGDGGPVLVEICSHCGAVSRYRQDDYRSGSLVGPCPPIESVPGR